MVIPARGEDPAQSLHRQLEASRGETLWVVHRLDRDTSGVFVLARTAEAHRQWSMAFSEGRVGKEYLALTRGTPAARSIQEPLRVDERGRVTVAARGQKGAKSAQTRLSVVRRWAEPDICLVRCLPTTGRQHQIRVHLAHLGAPLLADPLYGREAPPTAPLPIARTALHAERLVAPAALGGIEVEAPLPPDFVETLRALDQV